MGPRGLSLALLALALAAAPPPEPGAPRVGRRFRSAEPITLTFGDWVRRVLTKHRGPWRRFTPAVPAACAETQVDGGRLKVTFVNHGTALLQIDGVNVLTDPTWAERSVPCVGTRRCRPPGLALEDLPPIDAVLISHDHQDHLDLPTLRRLAAAHRPRVFAGLGTAAFLARKGIPRGEDLDWWQARQIAPGVTVTAVPSRHMSGRGLFDGDRRLWCGFVVSGAAGRVLYAGDTGYGAHFAKVEERFGPLRLALLPIGGANPAWYMAQQHLSPADAVRAARELRAATSVPVHYGTFPQSDDAELEPLQKLREALLAAPEPRPRFLVLDNGEAADIPPLEDE